MPATYQKRILSGKTPAGELVSLWVDVRDSKKTAYNLYVNRRCIQTLSGKPAAETRFESLLRDGYQDISFPEKLRDQARYIDEHRGEEFGNTLRFELLAAIERLASEEKGLGAVRLQMRDTLAHTLREVGPIPVNEKEAEDWAALVGRTLQAHYSKAATYAARVSLLLKVLRVAEDYPLVFKRWLPIMPLIRARIQESRKRRSGALEKPISRAPYSVKELEAFFKEMTFKETLLTLVYLQYGFRAKEAERLTERCVRAGKLFLSEVTTKTTTDKTPELFLLTRAALSYCRGALTAIHIAKKIDRQRLRPTAAVLMTLSGHDLLSITHRTGHANLRMLVNHYAKFLPEDYRLGMSFGQYTGCSELRLDGQRVEESAYDQWLLTLALKGAVERGELDFVALVKRIYVPHTQARDELVVNF